MAEKELSSTEIGDNFSPLKHTIRDLADDFNRSPSGKALTDCASNTVQNEALLRKAGLLKSSCPIKDLRALIKAARSIAVLREEDSDLDAQPDLILETLKRQPTCWPRHNFTELGRLTWDSRWIEKDARGIPSQTCHALQPLR
jgi:hypothetical protein